MTDAQVAALQAYYAVAPDPDFPTLDRYACRTCGGTFAVGQADHSRYTLKRLLAHAATCVITIRPLADR